MDQEYIKNNIQNLHSNWYIMQDGGHNLITRDRQIDYASHIEMYAVKLLEYSKRNNKNKFIDLNKLTYAKFKSYCGYKRDIEILDEHWKDCRALWFDLSELQKKPNRWCNEELEQWFAWGDFTLDLEFKYDIDGFGFRTDMKDKLSNDEYAWAFGCSQTFGLGIPTKATWVNIVEKQMNIPICNFSVPGTGIETSLRLLREWIQIPNIKKPKYIIMWGHYQERNERMDKFGNYRNIFGDSKNYNKNLKIIKDVCKNNSIKFLHIDINEGAKDDNLHNLLIDGYQIHARDLSHFGPIAHSIIAKKFMSMM